MEESNNGNVVTIYWDDGDYSFTVNTVFKGVRNGWVHTEAGKFRQDRVKHMVFGYKYNIGE